MSREAFRFRMLSRRCPIRFRTRYQQNTTVYKKQQQLLRSREMVPKDPSNEGAFRVRTLNRSSSLQRGSSMHHLQTHPVQVHVQCGKSDAFKMFASGSVKDSTRYIQAVTLHHHQSDWPQKSVKSKESLLRNNYGNQVIRHEL